MARRIPPARSWHRGIDDAARRRRSRSDDAEYELYEDDGEFVLSIDLPGFDRDDIDLRRHEGRLVVAAERVEENRDRERTYNRTFRLPKRVDSDEIAAKYRNGVLEVRLPIHADPAARGDPIEID